MPGLEVFFGLPGQDARRFVTLKTRVLIERGIDGIGNLCLIGGFFVVGFAGDGRAKIHHFAGRFVDEQHVFVRMGLLLAALMLLL